MLSHVFKLLKSTIVLCFLQKWVKPNSTTVLFLSMVQISFSSWTPKAIYFLFAFWLLVIAQIYSCFQIVGVIFRAKCFLALALLMVSICLINSEPYVAMMLAVVTVKKLQNFWIVAFVTSDLSPCCSLRICVTNLWMSSSVMAPAA